jgi:hypothetical protein
MLSVFSSDGSNSCKPFATDSLHAMMNAPARHTGDSNCPDFQGQDKERYALFLSVDIAFYAYGPFCHAEAQHLAEHLPRSMQLPDDGDWRLTVLPIRTDWPVGVPPLRRDPIVEPPPGEKKRTPTERKLLDDAKSTLPIAKFAIFGAKPAAFTLPPPKPRPAKKKQKTVLDMLRTE